MERNEIVRNKTKRVTENERTPPINSISINLRNVKSRNRPIASLINYSCNAIYKSLIPTYIQLATPTIYTEEKDRPSGHVRSYHTSIAVPSSNSIGPSALHQFWPYFNAEMQQTRSQDHIFAPRFAISYSIWQLMDAARYNTQGDTIRSFFSEWNEGWTTFCFMDIKIS